jgi:hypothetical protein
VETGEAHVVVWTICSDVLVLVLFELVHDLKEVVFTACITHVISGEVTVHTGAVPVALVRLAVVFNIDAILFAEALEDVASYPNLVACSVCTLAEYLEFPLTLSHFSIDAFVVDACVKADVEVLFNDRTCDVANRRVSCTAVVITLWCWVAFLRPAECTAVLEEEVFLLEADPETWIISDGRTRIGWVWCAIWIHYFAHDEEAVLTSAVWVACNRLKDAVRAAAFSL